MSLYLPSFVAKDYLYYWCNEFELPLELCDDFRTNTLAIRIFEDKIITLKSVSGKRNDINNQLFKEFRLELDGINLEGQRVKFISSVFIDQNLRKKEFYILVELDPNKFYGTASYLHEER